MRRIRRVELRVGRRALIRSRLPERLVIPLVLGTKTAAGRPRGATPMTERICSEFKVVLLLADSGEVEAFMRAKWIWVLPGAG